MAQTQDHLGKGRDCLGEVTKEPGYCRWEGSLRNHIVKNNIPFSLHCCPIGPKPVNPVLELHFSWSSTRTLPILCGDIATQGCESDVNRSEAQLRHCYELTV